MTTEELREQMVVRALVTMLSRMKHCEEMILYHSVGLLVTPPLAWTEFERALRYCDTQKRWLTMVKTPMDSRQWSLNGEGKAAAVEMGVA